MKISDAMDTPGELLGVVHDSAREVCLREVPPGREAVGTGNAAGDGDYARGEVEGGQCARFAGVHACAPVSLQGEERPCLFLEMFGAPVDRENYMPQLCAGDPPARAKTQPTGLRTLWALICRRKTPRAATQIVKKSRNIWRDRWTSTKVTGARPVRPRRHQQQREKRRELFSDYLTRTQGPQYFKGNRWNVGAKPFEPENGHQQHAARSATKCLRRLAPSL
eukprot:g20619.t1